MPKDKFDSKYQDIIWLLVIVLIFAVSGISAISGSKPQYNSSHQVRIYRNGHTFGHCLK